MRAPNAPVVEASPYLLVLLYAVLLVIVILLAAQVLRPFLPGQDRRDADLARDEEARRRALRKANQEARR